MMTRLINIPEMTSAEALEQYPAGLRIAGGEGPSWSDVRVSIFSLDGDSEHFQMPAIAEPFIVWIMSGEAETMEREIGSKDWIASLVQTNSLFLTSSCAPYEFKWRRLSTEPFQVMIASLSIPLIRESLKELHGRSAHLAIIPDRSAFKDEQLITLLGFLNQEIVNTRASQILIRGIAQTISVHLSRHYSVLTEESKEDKSRLPNYKLKNITSWMEDNLTEEFSLGKLAEQAGMSEYHFNRLFKRSIGLPPSQYQIALRLDRAKKLLRETKLDVIDVANEVGYINASHFTRLFRKVSGMTPSDYRKSQS